MVGYWWRRAAVMGLFGAAACGGLASDGPGSQEPVVDDDVGVIDEEALPEPSSPPSQAVASLLFGAQGGACPASMEYLVPNSDALSTLENGSGERAIDGRGGDIRCRVASLPDPNRSFAVDLMYREGFGSDNELRVFGELSGGRAGGTVMLKMNLAQAGLIEAECRAEVREVLSGAIWLRTDDCANVSYDGDPVDCDVELGMIFEYCSR